MTRAACLRQRVCPAAAVALAICGHALAANPTRGATIFGANCGVCHIAQRDAAPADLATRLGPNLWGVVDRKAGTYKGFAYSYAMRSSGIIWTADQLRTYLAAPQKTVPNVRMSFAGLKNPQDIEDVVAYLSTLK